LPLPVRMPTEVQVRAEAQELAAESVLAATARLAQQVKAAVAEQPQEQPLRSARFAGRRMQRRISCKIFDSALPLCRNEYKTWRFSSFDKRDDCSVSARYHLLIRPVKPYRIKAIQRKYGDCCTRSKSLFMCSLLPL